MDVITPTARVSACATAGWSGVGSRRAFRCWYVQNVEFATSGGLSGRLSGGIVRDMVSVDDVVVPIPLTLLESTTSEFECTFPATGFGRVFSQGILTGVVVPGSDEMDRLTFGASAQRKVELDCCHDVTLLVV